MARRGNAEGSIHRRNSDGRWVAAISTDGRRKYYYGKTRSEVAEKLRTAQALADGGVAVGDDRVTVGAYLRDWLRTKSELRPRTLEGYRINVENHLVPAIGRIPLTRLLIGHIERLHEELRAAGLSPSTIRHIHATLRGALERAVRSGLVPRNVARLVSPPRLERAEGKFLTPEEARKFLRSVAEDRDRGLYAVALGLGLRKGELSALTWDDVDLRAGLVHVRRTLQRYDGAYHFGPPKTDRSRRTLAAPVPLVDELKAHRARQLEERLALGPAWVGDEWGLVFCRKDGYPLDPSGLTRRFQQRLEEAGLPKMRFHELRHSSASFMIAQGVPLRVIQDVLGHADIGVTANIYGTSCRGSHGTRRAKLRRCCGPVPDRVAVKAAVKRPRRPLVTLAEACKH